jgi:hypothetical protein
MTIHPGEKVLRRIRRNQLTRLFADARRDANRDVGKPDDQWRNYAIAMGRKTGIIPPDADVSCVMRGTLATFYSMHENRWNQRIQGEKIGEYRIPDHVWSYQPLWSEYEVAE